MNSKSAGTRANASASFLDGSTTIGALFRHRHEACQTKILAASRHANKDGFDSGADGAQIWMMTPPIQRSMTNFEIEIKSRRVSTQVANAP